MLTAPDSWNYTSTEYENGEPTGVSPLSDEEVSRLLASNDMTSLGALNLSDNTE
jgi:hypothetical protein